MTIARRTFLQQTGAAAVVGGMYRIRGPQGGSREPGDLIPEADEALLQQLAHVAVDAARGAGAEFADVRVTAVRAMYVTASMDRAMPSGAFLHPPSLDFETDYGIRVLVDGVWGFAGGYTLTPAAVAEVARRAVARGRANRLRRTGRPTLTPVPRVEDGRWATPIERGPFTVPLGGQCDLMLAAVGAARTVRGVSEAGVQFSWSQTLQIFASSEGSLIVQRFATATPSARITGRSRESHAWNGLPFLPGLRAGAFGYEAVSHAGFDMVKAMRQAAERVVAESGPPEPAPVSTEVGRYDLILGKLAVSRVLVETIVPALNLERVLGYYANGVGTSFAGPPEDVLGKYRVAAPLLTVRANRTQAHGAMTVGWDDEGAPAGEYTLVEDGVIVDYLTSRQTAAELAPIYRARGDVVQSRGCVVGRGQERPAIGVPNLTIEPGRENLSLDDLIANTKRGFYVPRIDGGADQQLLSGQFMGMNVREIRNGKLGRPIKDFAFQFVTPQLWTKLDALGGRESALDGGDVTSGMSVVPVRVREVNVLNTGMTL